MKSTNQLFVLLMVLFIAQIATAQITFQTGYGGTLVDEARSIRQTFDKGYIIAGQTKSFGQGNYDAYLIKTDSLGTMAWSATFGGVNADYIYSVIQSADSGFVMVGWTLNFSSANKDIYLLKTDVNGTLLWSKIIGWSGDDEGHSVRQTSDGGYIISGQCTVGIDQGACLVKTDANGDVVWMKKFDQTGLEAGYAAEQTTDSGYIMIGFAQNSLTAGNSDIFLVKTNANGLLRWNKLYGGTDNEFGYSVRQTNDGGYILTGTSASFGSGYNDVCLIKTNSLGDTVWAKTYGDAPDDVGFSVLQTTDNGYIVGGYSEGFGAGANDYYLLKVNENGNLQWSKSFGASSDEKAFSVQECADGGYILAGNSNGLGLGLTECYIVKTDALGNSGCNEGNAATTVSNCPLTVSVPATTTTSGGTYSNVSPWVNSGGAESIFCQTGISEARGGNSPVVFPNPFTNQLTVSGLKKHSMVELYDVMGVLALKVNVQEENMNMNTENLKPGLYFLRYTQGTSMINVKVIKN